MQTATFIAYRHDSQAVSPHQSNQGRSIKNQDQVFVTEQNREGLESLIASPHLQRHWNSFIRYEVHSFACIRWFLRPHGPSKSIRCPVSSRSFCHAVPGGSAMFFWSFCAQSAGMEKLSSILSSALFIITSFFGH